MLTNTQATEKRTAVESLDSPARTSKRVAWASWSSRLIGLCPEEVCKESYRFLKSEHAYVLGVEDRDGVLVHAECECPSDVLPKPACKHRVALATVGDPSALNSAVVYANPSQDSSAATGRDRLTTDGRVSVKSKADDCINLSDLLLGLLQPWSAQP